MSKSFASKEGSSMVMLVSRFKEVVSDPDTKVVVLTGTDPYYCAGVNLSATIQPMHPKKLHNMIYTRSVCDLYPCWKLLNLMIIVQQQPGSV